MPKLRTFDSVLGLKGFGSDWLDARNRFLRFKIWLPSRFWLIVMLGFEQNFPTVQIFHPGTTSSSSFSIEFHNNLYSPQQIHLPANFLHHVDQFWVLKLIWLVTLSLDFFVVMSTLVWHILDSILLRFWMIFAYVLNCYKLVSMETFLNHCCCNLVFGFGVDITLRKNFGLRNSVAQSIMCSKICMLI